MLVFGVVASDLSLFLYRAAMELAFSPLDTLLAFAHGGSGAPETRAGPPRGRAWARSWRAAPDRTAASSTSWGQAAAPRPTRDDFYAAQLRRAAPVVRLFAAASPGGEKEAAYHALVRLAAAADADLGPWPGGTHITPGTLYRDLTRGAQWRMPGVGGSAFDAVVCAELDRRDAAGA
jgi:hypothetical protein